MITINVVTMNRVVLIMMVLIIMMMIRTILYMTILSVEPFLRTTTFLVMLVLSVLVILLYRVAMVCVVSCMGSVVCFGERPAWRRSGPRLKSGMVIWTRLPCYGLSPMDRLILLFVPSSWMVRMTPEMRTARPGPGSMRNSIVCSTVLCAHHHPRGPGVRTVTFGRRPFPYAGPVQIR